MIENRRLQRSGQFTYRLYKPSSDEEALVLVDTFQKHYQRSIVIESCGKVTDKHLHDFANMCDDLAYEQLRFKPEDRYILTKEITHLKLEDDKRITNSKKFHKKLPASVTWSEEHQKHLWRGTPDVVAKIVNKSSDEVEKERQRYIQNNPGFEYPKECRKPRKNAKVEVKKVPWIPREIEVLWDFPTKETAMLLKRSIYEITEKRKERCLQNPDFIIPLSAKFSKGDLPNPVEVVTKTSQNLEFQNVEKQSVEKQHKGSFWERHKDVLWNNSPSEIVEILSNERDLTEKAIYQSRLIFLQKNKGFVIPKASQFKMGSSYDRDRYDFTYEQDIPAEIKEAQPAISQIREERQTEPQESQPIVSEQQQQSQTTQPEETNNFDKIAVFLNNLLVKPKKITVGDITLEF
jgi:hypothetical protein